MIKHLIYIIAVLLITSCGTFKKVSKDIDKLAKKTRKKARFIDDLED